MIFVTPRPASNVRTAAGADRAKGDPWAAVLDRQAELHARSTGATQPQPRQQAAAPPSSPPAPAAHRDPVMASWDRVGRRVFGSAWKGI